MDGLEAGEFRKMFHNKPAESFDVFCNERIKHRQLKAVVKKRSELFLGQTVERYYAFGATYLTDTD